MAINNQDDIIIQKIEEWYFKYPKRKILLLTETELIGEHFIAVLVDRFQSKAKSSLWSMLKSWYFGSFVDKHYPSHIKFTSGGSITSVEYGMFPRNSYYDFLIAYGLKDVDKEDLVYEYLGCMEDGESEIFTLTT